MTNAEILGWLKWHHDHALYIWGSMAALAVAGRVQRHLRHRQTEEPDARWATLADLRKAKMDGACGPVIGKYEGYLLRSSGEGHLLTIARPRTGKSSAEVVPTLLEPQPQTSLLVNDAKGELHAMTHRYQEAQGRRVYRLDATSSTSDHCNPFDLIRLGEPEESGDLRLLAHMIGNPDEKPVKDANDAFWEGNVSDATQALILCGLLTGRATNPAMFHALLGTTVMGDLITDLDNTGHHRCVQAATTLKEMTENQQKSIITNIRRNFAIYGDELVARMTSRSDFRPEDLRTGTQPSTLYVSVPFDDDELIQVNRVFLRQVLGRLARRNPTPSTARRSMHGWDLDLLVLVDEGHILKKVDLFSTLLDFSAGFGLRIWYITPSLARLEALYGKNNFLESTAVQIYFGIVDGEVAKTISTRLGTRGVTQVRVSKGRGGTTRTRETVRKPLMDASAILHLDDRQLIVFADKAQMLVEQLPWYQYEPWKSRGDSLQ